MYLVSIIIPCYNMGTLLLETIDSVQKVIDPAKHEVLIVNDGSTDGETLKVLDGLRSRYTIIDQHNQGLSAARNTGILAATGKYLLFLDADNLLTDAYLTQGVAVMETHAEIDIVYGPSMAFGGEKEFLLPVRPFNLQMLMIDNYIDACCLVRKTAFDGIGLFDTNMKVGMEDWEMWLRMAFNQRKFYFLEGTVVQKYRVRSNSMIHTIGKNRRDSTMEYIAKKYPEQLDFDAMSDFTYRKFKAAPLGWTAKFFIKRFSEPLFNYLVSKGKIRKHF